MSSRRSVAKTVRRGGATPPRRHLRAGARYDPAAFPAALRELRARAGLSQTEAARRAHIRRQSWWNMEEGRHAPKVPILLAALEAVGASLSDLDDAMRAESGD